MYPHPESTLADVKQDRRGRGSGGSWGKALRLGIPFVLAALLAAVAIFLLVREAQRTREIEASLKIPPQYSRTPIPPEGYPRGSPTDPKPVPLKRYGGEYPRWNLKELPQGWDPALAKTIHSYFEAMTVDLMDDVKLSELQRIREEFAEFLAKLGPEALPTLAAILNAEGDFVNRRFLLKAIGNLGPSSEAATFVLRDFYMARHSDIRNDSEMWHVIDAMTQLKNESSFRVLTDFIEDPDPNVDRHRSHFVEALGEHPRRHLQLQASRFHPG